MPEKTLIARIRADDERPGTLIVASPAVGIAHGAPAAGLFLNRLGPVLSLYILGKRHVVRLPRDVQGWTVECYVTNGRTPVAFDQPLVRINPHAGEAAAVETGGPAGAEAADRGTAVIVASPTEGIFYRRPAPDAPPFVEVGGSVVAGTVLGLVEVMKCFNQITYGGPGLPPRGRVVRIVAEDSSEVRFGQPLFHVEPE